jgi:uncharacterized RDD family membrane protein YckC
MTDIIAEDGQQRIAPARTHPWTDTSAHPWRRFFARTLDLGLFSVLSFILIGGVLTILAPDLLDPFIVLVVIAPVLSIILAAPWIALAIGLTGGTPGKWLFGVRVANAEGRPIGIAAAFLRELKVASVGTGLGIPIVSLFFLWQAQEHLVDRKKTTWDEDGEHVVSHRLVNAWQIILFIVGGSAWLALRAWGMVEQFISLAG